MAPASLAYGDGWPGGHWFIFAMRSPVKPGYGCSVFLLNDETGYAVRRGGPALVD